jgi:hypothetical protein
VIQRIRYRLRYAWRKACHFMGFCPFCGERVNFTPSGSVLCPNCRKR